MTSINSNKNWINPTCTIMAESWNSWSPGYFWVFLILLLSACGCGCGCLRSFNKIEWYVWRARWETIICTWYVLFLYSTVPSHDIFSISPSRLKNFFDMVSNVFENLLSIFCIDSAPNQRKEQWKWKLWKKSFLFTCTFYLGQLLLDSFNVFDMITLKLFCHFQAFQRIFNHVCLLTDLSAGQRPLLLLAP